MITIKLKSIVIAIWLLLLNFITIKSQAQNCTVNAGNDASYCYSQGLNSINTIQTLFTLNGNSAGNLNAVPNLLWEIVSTPLAANIVLNTPSNNTTTVNAKFVDAPTGIYKFRLGIECLNGGRVFDTVQITITNIADFQLFASKRWSDICANVQDSIKLVGRALKAGETLMINGSEIIMTASNPNAALATFIVGPSLDSVRFTIKNINYNVCSLNEGPKINYSIRNGTCVSSSREPIFNDLSGLMGSHNLYLSKPYLRQVDSINCTFNSITSLSAYNLCFLGGRNSSNNIGTYSVTKLAGSGVMTGFFDAGTLYYYIANNWDTVTANTMNSFEITFNGNGCYPTFKDTINAFFKSNAPSVNGFTFTNGFNYGELYFCAPNTFPLSSFTFKLVNSGTVPSKYKFTTTGYLETPYTPITIANPNRKDSLTLNGPLNAGKYILTTQITDTTNGCSINYETKVNILKRFALPYINDTIICGNSNFINIPFPAGTFGVAQYGVNVVNVSSASYIYDNLLQVNLGGSAINYTTGYDVIVSPNTSNTAACTNNRSDTFHITMVSGGHVSNAGTDQALLCNVASTNLAGSLPSSTGGSAGFWKFLPAISTNAGAPIVITDTANRTTAISGFSNLSSYYFSWNVTDGNFGNYCNLKPDTVLVVFSGIPPTNVHAAQADFMGCIPVGNTYTITSNAPTPTFNVQWNILNGPTGGLIDANKQNATLTGILAGIYEIEMVVSNTCGIFKDTVRLNFIACPLPLKLISFSGVQNNNNNILNWKMAEEVNIKKYDIEFSNDGLRFNYLNNVYALNNFANYNNYSFIHLNALNSINYYRLKFVKNDDSFTYSNILKLKQNEIYTNVLEVFPLPAKTFLNINFQSNNTINTNLKLVNTLGKTVLLKSILCNTGNNTFVLDVESLARGVYILQVGSLSKKIILQ